MRRRVAFACASTLALATSAAPSALAQDVGKKDPGRNEARPEPRVDPTVTALSAEGTAPPPLHVPYLQYGVALTGEFVIAPGPICSAHTEPPSCILNSGGGIGVRVGVRSAGPWYLGGAYELSKQDPDNLYRLAILQQLRGEVRYYVDTGRDVQPIALGGIGIAGYGNSWSIDTWGPMAYLGAGLEVQISRRTVAEFALNARLLYLSGMTDTSGTKRDGGIASIFGLELGLAQRDPL